MVHLEILYQQTGGGGGKSLGGGELPISPTRHIAESIAAGVSESSSSNAGGSSRESRANLQTIDEPILPTTNKIVEIEDFVNRSTQIATTNTQELGMTIEKSSPAKELLKEQKTHELLSKTLGGLEDSTVQAGKVGDIKQE